jgi:hypothetical protein
MEGRGGMQARKEERRKVVCDGWCLCLRTSVFFAVSCTLYDRVCYSAQSVGLHSL